MRYAGKNAYSAGKTNGFLRGDSLGIIGAMCWATGEDGGSVDMSGRVKKFTWIVVVRYVINFRASGSFIIVDFGGVVVLLLFFVLPLLTGVKQSQLSVF